MQSLSHPQGLVVFEASEEKRATPICELLKSQCETKNAHEIDEALEKIGNVNGSRGDGIYEGERYVLHRFLLHAFTQDLEKQFAASLPFIFAEKKTYFCAVIKPRCSIELRMISLKPRWFRSQPATLYVCRSIDLLPK